MYLELFRKIFARKIREIPKDSYVYGVTTSDNLTLVLPVTVAGVLKHGKVRNACEPSLTHRLAISVLRHLIALNYFVPPRLL